jgi:hypothetical protein
MGRGRAKAKQQKVARELKYNTQSTDFSALQRELGHPAESGYGNAESQGDPYADDDYEDEDTWVGGSR